ncbi:hypothetical protein V8G61_07740 [Gaetbulibacter sp. M240]|uniref:hypothetical protein n=1 Tax=Gaetbulibacter sp. M240 TaxID=3126511 RepID=UPI00374F43AE
MIKFFRKIRQNLLLEGNTVKYFKYAIGEIVLVVIGILIALQLNNAKENWQREKLRQELFIELRSSIMEDTLSLNREKNRLKSAYINAMLLKRVIKEDLPYTESLDSSLALIRRASIITADYKIYDRLLALGMDVINDKDLSNEIVHYYEDSKNQENTGEDAIKLLKERIYPNYFISYSGSKAVPEDFEKLKKSNEFKIALDYSSRSSYSLIGRSVHRKNLATEILKILDKKITTDRHLLDKEPYIRTAKKDTIDMTREYDKLKAIINDL